MAYRTDKPLTDLDDIRAWLEWAEAERWLRPTSAGTRDEARLWASWPLLPCQVGEWTLDRPRPATVVPRFEWERVIHSRSDLRHTGVRRSFVSPGLVALTIASYGNDGKNWTDAPIERPGQGDIFPSAESLAGDLGITSRLAATMRDELIVAGWFVKVGTLSVGFGPERGIPILRTSLPELAMLRNLPAANRAASKATTDGDGDPWAPKGAKVGYSYYSDEPPF